MKYRVLHVTFSDSSGSGIAVCRTHKALLDAGCESDMLVANKQTNATRVHSLKYDLLRKIWRRVQLGIEKWQKRKMPVGDMQLRSSNLVPGFILGEIAGLKPDLVHLHWVHSGMLSMSEIQRIPCPVMWTAHDMWIVTGSSHYAGSLFNDWNIAGAAATMGKLDASLFCKYQEKRFSEIMLTKPEGIITPSSWLGKLVKNSSFKGRKWNRVIPNCIDLSVFSPSTERDRSEFPFPLDKKILLFGTASITDHRKGLDLLMDAIECLPDKIIEDCVLAVFGGDIGVGVINGMECVSLGRLDSDQKLAEVYRRCDVFLCPSREDNYPNTVLEAGACGLPVVAFRIGGILEIVLHKETGYLAEPYDQLDFAQAITYAILNQKRLGSLAADHIKIIASERKHATRLMELYENVLNPPHIN